MTKQLNAFEIKHEISRIVKALEASTILIDTAEFKTLDEQEDKSQLTKILLKEFMLCDESRINVIKLLLIRYLDETELLQKMETIIKDPQNDNKIKLYAIEVISAFNPKWHEENYDSYLEYDEELVQRETKELLESSEENPEIQLDFMDFLGAISSKDKKMLLTSLEEDQQSRDLAHVLVPVFLSYPYQEIGQSALKMLNTSRSPYAYLSLFQVYDKLKPEIQPAVKKILNELKLSGASKGIPTANIENAKFYLIPPDGEGNISLLYIQNNETNQSVRLIGIVLDDYDGIRECLGFNAISPFEASFLTEKLTGADYKVEIEPDVFKKLLDNAELINYKESAPPYEYNCWKKVFINIKPAEFNIEKFLSEKLDLSPISEKDINETLNSDITTPWYYTEHFGDETEAFFKKLDKLLNTQDIEKANIDEFIDENINEVIYETEQTKWKQRLMLTSYTEYLQNNLKKAQIFYNFAKDNVEIEKMYHFILMQTVFQYFIKKLEERDFSKYKRTNLENIVSYLTKHWGFYV